MSKTKRHIKCWAIISAGLLIMSIDVLVLLHFIIIEHHYHAKSELVQYFPESDNQCQVGDYFSINLSIFKIMPESDIVEYKENLPLPDLYIRYSDMEIEKTSRGPPALLINIA